jgi:hypothetical protein
LPEDGVIRKIRGVQLNIPKTFQPRFPQLAANVFEIKGRRDHVLPIPKTGLAGQKIKILGIRVHIHMDRKTEAIRLALGDRGQAEPDPKPESFRKHKFSPTDSHCERTRSVGGLS